MTSNSVATAVETAVSEAVQRKKPIGNGSEKSITKDHIYGRTPSGTVFVVPQTHDMVRNLLDPRVNKSLSDVTIVGILMWYIVLFWWVPQTYRPAVFLVLFGFWRVAYNGGIGWLLYQQSSCKLLTKLADQYKLFDKSNDTFLGQLIKRDLSVKFKGDATYNFESAPLEYNTWLLFRNLVDLILMSDFTCYILLAFSCASTASHSWVVVIGRWTAGIILFLFNLWVKIDAHRVVKDYAWYWGDFFFLEDVNLTFDGVFEMAPHPMYSIGYAGYYGICLMAASYVLFLASVLAHAAQFAFLIVVENPHIDKTYNNNVATKPRKKRSSNMFSNNNDTRSESSSKRSEMDNPDEEDEPSRAMLVFKNFTVTRSTDLMVVFLASHYSLLYFTPNTTFWFILTFGSALLWRLFHNVGLGYLLYKQSESKSWTRIFLKFGKSTLDAYQQWQAIYNMSTVMSYVSFVVVCLRQWTSPVGVPFWPFRYIVGLMMIALQMWTSYSIYESLGEYGWFFGDFFYTKSSQRLTYSGIYRYLNNPERLFGIAGVWGMALVSNSSPVTFLAFMWTYGGMAFIRFVEQPHMQKLYGSQIRQEAGVTKTLKQATKLASPLESKVNHFQGSIDKVVSETKVAVEAFLNQAKPRINDAVQDTKVLLKQYPARMTIVRLADDVNVDTSVYELKIVSKSSITSELVQAEYGEALTVEWNADPNHSKKDWIGLYRLTDGIQTEVTRVTSSGRWSAVDKTGYDGHIDGILTNHRTTGQVKFSGNMLFWEKGVYEFRYHHDGMHNVLAISQPFEIVASTVDIDDDADRLAEGLLRLVRRCYEGTDFEAPESIHDPLDVDDGSAVIKRLAYGIKEIYNVDLAPAVIVLDEDTLRISNRLIKVKNALRPFVQLDKQQ
jgi:phosphatidylethanolamine N-methyltransferase